MDNNLDFIAYSNQFRIRCEYYSIPMLTKTEICVNLYISHLLCESDSKLLNCLLYSLCFLYFKVYRLLCM